VKLLVCGNIYFNLCSFFLKGEKQAEEADLNLRKLQEIENIVVGSVDVSTS